MHHLNEIFYTVENEYSPVGLSATPERVRTKVSEALGDKLFLSPALETASWCNESGYTVHLYLHPVLVGSFRSSNQPFSGGRNRAKWWHTTLSLWSSLCSRNFFVRLPGLSSPGPGFSESSHILGKLCYLRVSGNTSVFR